MKKKITPVLIVLTSLLLCGCAPFLPPSTGGSSSEESSSLPSSSDSSSEVSSEPSSSSEKVIKSTRVVDTKENYIIGDIFSEVNGLKLSVTYTDNSVEYIDLVSPKITSVREKGTSTVIDPTLPFSKGAIYEAFITHTYDGKAKTGKLEVTVLNGLESGLALTSFELNEVIYVINKTFISTLDAATFTAVWDNGAIETYNYLGNEEVINVSLFKDGETTDVTDQPIEGGTTYNFKANLVGHESIVYETSFTTEIANGFYTLEKSEIIYEDFSIVSPHEGVANMLVIPIELSALSSSRIELEVYTDDDIQFINDMFFGEKEDTPDSWNSMKTYYDAASGGMVQIQGVVTSVYRPSVELYDIDSVNRSYATLHELFNDAIKFVKSNDTNIDWTQYDLNNDGYIDNLHFITNPTNVNDNDVTTWPHKYVMYTNYPGTNTDPNGYVYETTTLGHFNDARTIIHEQGHMFGIPDYYDYSYTGVDYVGAYDMQSHNMFDWNSWSKLSVGWGGAVVIDGTLNSTTVSIKSASVYNECLIIPADIETYNNSAFDEFFMLELFTNDGNNAHDFAETFPTAHTNAGIRLYHVDARLYDPYRQVEVETKEQLQTARNVDVGVNNTYNYYEYAHAGNHLWGDFKHLALIQKEGIDEFGNKSNGKIEYLELRDLFYAGDKFEFDKYDHFLSKTGKETTTMDNGEIFPYEIEIVSVTKEEAIIRVNKVL